MKSINPIGMAHDGICEIPNEETWLLDGGKRAVDQRWCAEPLKKQPQVIAAIVREANRRKM